MIGKKRRFLVFSLALISAATLGMMSLNARSSHEEGAEHSAPVATPAISKQQLVSYVKTYAKQGRHNTGSTVDKRDAKWLIGKLRSQGLQVQTQSINFTRATGPDSRIVFDYNEKRTLIGIPLLNSTATPSGGMSGRMGDTEEDGVIPVFHLYVMLPNGRITSEMIKRNHKEFYQLLNSGKYPAVFAITQGMQTGLAPLNINLQQHFPIPVILLSSKHGNILESLAKINKKVFFKTQINRKPASTQNIIATVAGSDSSLAPIVVMTSRTAWRKAAASRGTAVAAWLAVALQQQKLHPKRTIKFVILAGNELNHLGYQHFLKQHAAMLKNAYAWIYINGNIAAGNSPKYLVKVSNSKVRDLVTAQLQQHQISNVEFRSHKSKVAPNAMTIAFMGLTNPCFHLQCDVWPGVVNMNAETQFAQMLNGVVTKLAQ